MQLFDAYQGWTKSTAVYPDADEGRVLAVVYTALGLAGEAGEIANKAKKLLRDGDSFKLRNDIRDELGDVLWYLARLTDELGVELSNVAHNNREKLESRKDRGVIGGSGDNR